MKILFLPKYYQEGASSRYRTHNYIHYFVNAGHEVTVKPLFYDGYVMSKNQKKTVSRLQVIECICKRTVFLLLKKKKFDLIVIEKELFPFIPLFFERWLLKKTAYTLDYDDAVSTRYRGHKLKQKLLGEKINLLSKDAKLTTVGNKWYWQEIRYGSLKYLPTVVDITHYPWRQGEKVQNAMPIITWIGSPSTVKYLNLLRNVLIRLTEHIQFKLRIIGGDFNMEGVEVELLPWSSAKEFEYLATSDIGIMPLQETPWENGKCGFKCIQYMAAGLPVVASALPANKEIIVHGETGFIAKTEEEWFENLRLLLLDETKRAGMGKNGRVRVETKYSYQVWGPKYVKYIEACQVE